MSTGSGGRLVIGDERGVDLSGTPREAPLNFGLASVPEFIGEEFDHCNGINTTHEQMDGGGKKWA